MTEQGKRSPLARMYCSTWGRVVLAGAVTAVLLSAFSAVQTVSYLTNDDNAIAYTLAGYHTGEPAPYALFINCLLGFFVSGLYSAAPGVSWWAVLQLAAIAVSATAIGACMLRLCAARRVPLLVPLAGFALLLALVMLQPVVEPTYTVTAAVVGAAGCALVVGAADGDGRKGKRVVMDVLGCCFVVAAFLYREETGFAVLCFFLAACGYRALTAVRGDTKSLEAAEHDASAGSGDAARDRDGASLAKNARRRGVKRAVIVFAATLAVCMAAFAANNLLQTAYHGAEYREFFRWRERFTDYPRDSYSDNPALYESVGWSEAVYGLADSWCFMDARIDAVSLRTVTEGSSAPKTTFVQAAADCLAVIEEELPLRLTAAWLLCAGAMALYTLLRNRRRAMEAVALLCILLGGAALCLLLGLSGRFLARTFRVIAIPACVLAALLTLSIYEPQAGRTDRVVRGAFYAAFAVLALAAGFFQARELRVNSPKHLLSDSRAVTGYALMRPENVYIRGTYVVTDVDATTTYPDEKPVNLISWGGCEMHSKTARRQLAANGLKSCYADVFRGENVFFITRTGSGEHAVMARYLEETYPGAYLDQADAVTDEIGVYRVIFPDGGAVEAGAERGGA